MTEAPDVLGCSRARREDACREEARRRREGGNRPTPSRPTRPTTWSPPGTSCGSDAGPWSTPRRPAGSCSATRSTRTASSPGSRPKAEMSMTSYVVEAAPANRPVTFAFNGGPGSSSVWLHLGLLGPRRVRHGRRRGADPAAVRAGRQRRVPARGQRPGLHRPGVDRVLACRRGHQARAVPRLPGRPRVGRRADPAVDARATTAGCRRSSSPASPTARPRGAALAEHLQTPLRDVPQRADPDLQRARPRVARLREPAQRPGARDLPADVRRGRALPRQARPQVAAVGARRGRGVRLARLPLGAVARRPADRQGARRARPSSSPR